MAKTIRYVHMSKDGYWSEWDEYTTKDKWDSNVFHIYATDCDEELSKIANSPKIVIELEAFNGDSHFSHEDG